MGSVLIAPEPIMTRRTFLLGSVAAVAAAFGAACSDDDVVAPPTGPGSDGRLHARPAPPSGEVTPGRHLLPIEGARDTILYVPAGYQPDTPAPLMVLLHGGGGDAAEMAPFFFPLADREGIVLVMPNSVERTWDAVREAIGPDVIRIDDALGRVFDRCAVDPTRLAIAGFSAGGSYALSLGLTNGDLFTHVIAFSPGSVRAPELVGRPPVFISHGTLDSVLHIDRTSRVIVPALRDLGYDVLYREFTGGHVVPLAIAEDALEWFLG